MSTSVHHVFIFLILRTSILLFEATITLGLVKPILGFRVAVDPLALCLVANTVYLRQEIMPILSHNNDLIRSNKSFVSKEPSSFNQNYWMLQSKLSFFYELQTHWKTCAKRPFSAFLLAFYSSYSSAQRFPLFM